MSEISEPRPKCGGGGINADDYDLPLHVIALFLVLGTSIGGCAFPVIAKKIKWLKIPPKVFFFCKHFGTGVLIATAFVHLLPTAFQSLNDPCLPPLFTEQYPPLPGVIMMFSLFVLFIIELWLNAKTGGHSHGGATGEGLAYNASSSGPFGPGYRYHARQDSLSSEFTAVDEDARGISSSKTEAPQYPMGESEMPAWFVAFYEQYIHERERMLSLIQSVMSPKAPEPDYHRKEIASSVEQDPELGPVDSEVFRKMSLNITLLEGGILFHSVFVGMTVSIETDGFIVLLIAILFHQSFEGLGLGSRIAAVPYPKDSIRPWLLVVAFGTTAPIGQAIGLIARTSYDPNSAFALILVGTFNAISSGLLIYAALVDLLAEDFLREGHTMSKRQKILGFCYVLMGAAGMSIVGAFA
ncbi:ZIP zinc transporter [Thermoascus aurantiacus ATCC 26904]